MLEMFPLVKGFNKKLNAVSKGATSLEGILSQWKHGNDWQVPKECDHTEGEREVKKKRYKK